VAVVGARDASSYGESVAGSLGADLVLDGWTVVSGAALGIDAAAHRGALAAEGSEGLVPTVAVLGCGVDRPYPPTHGGLLDRIAASGAVVAELPPGSSPYPWRFPARNRVIAALASGVVVVEAGPRSGAVGTARAADALSRRVMAVPGPVHSRRSTGCHRLIRDGATLVTGVRDVLDAVGPIDGGEGEDGSSRDARAARVLRCLSRTRERSVDEVAAMAGMDPADARSVLLDLEILDETARGVTGWRRAATARGRSSGV
jgi:DNA processing protein